MVPVRALAAVCVAAATMTTVPGVAMASDTLPSGQRDQRADRADRARASLVRVALSKRGARYVPGASGPWSFDCSGFTMWVYRQATGRSLPHYSGAQMARSHRVSRAHLQPGDLMFFGPGGSQHVSMYIGKGKMIHATNPRSGVRVDSINMGYYRARFAGAGRFITG